MELPENCYAGRQDATVLIKFPSEALLKEFYKNSTSKVILNGNIAIYTFDTVEQARGFLDFLTSDYDPKFADIYEAFAKEFNKE
jgi:hypothetical protein